MNAPRVLVSGVIANRHAPVRYVRPLSAYYEEVEAGGLRPVTFVELLTIGDRLCRQNRSSRELSTGVRETW